MSNIEQDKAMDVAAQLHDWYSTLDRAQRAHIEAMQRDCRTCDFIVYDFGAEQGVECSFHGGATKCVNHSCWTPFKFKQLTRSE